MGRGGNSDCIVSERRMTDIYKGQKNREADTLPHLLPTLSSHIRLPDPIIRQRPRVLQHQQDRLSIGDAHQRVSSSSKRKREVDPDSHSSARLPTPISRAQTSSLARRSQQGWRTGWRGRRRRRRCRRGPSSRSGRGCSGTCSCPARVSQGGRDESQGEKAGAGRSGEGMETHQGMSESEHHSW